MQHLKALREKGRAAAARMEALSKAAADEGREMTDDEIAEFEKCEKSVARISDEIERLSKSSDRSKLFEEPEEPAPAPSKTVKGVTQDRGAVTVKNSIQVRDDLNGLQIIGICAWGAAKAKHYSRKTPLEHIEDAGFQKIADMSRETTDFISRNKAFQSITVGGGDNTIDTPLSTEFIEFLYNSSAFLRGNPIELDMSFGSIKIPGGNAGASATYIGEGDDAPYTQATTRSISLSAKHLSAVTAISNYNLEISPLAVAQILGDDLNMAMMLAIDSAGLRGDGSGDTPAGILSLVAAAHKISAAAPANAAVPTYAETELELKRMVTRAETNNIPRRRQVWIMSGRSKIALEYVKDGNGNPMYPGLSNDSPTLKGRPVIMSEQVPSNLGTGTNESEIYLVDFGHVLFGIARAVRLKASDEATYLDAGSNVRSAFSRDETVIRGTASHDFDMRHDKAAVVLQAVLWGDE